MMVDRRGFETMRFRGIIGLVLKKEKQEAYTHTPQVCANVARNRANKK
jgi:hypothetical protein